MKRHQETDALKAFSIIGVIWIHSSALVQDSYIKIPSSYFRFCVPVFIIISFYLLGKKKLAKESQTFKDSIKEGKNRIIRLFIPFIFWSVFYILIFHFNDFNWRNITTYFGGENWAGQYYFLIIIQLTMIFFLISNSTPINFRIVLLSALIAISLYIFFLYKNHQPIFDSNGVRIGLLTVDISVYLWSYYPIFGMWLAQKPESKSNSLVIILIFIIPFLLVVEEHLLRKANANIDPYGRISVLFVSSIMTYLTLGKKIFNEKEKIAMYTEKISRYSLGIFCINPIIIYLLSKYSQSYLNFQNLILTTFVSLLIPFFVLIVSMFIIKLLKLIGLKTIVE